MLTLGRNADASDSDASDSGSDNVDSDSDDRVRIARQQDVVNGTEMSNSHIRNGIVDVSSEASLPRDESRDNAVTAGRSAAGNIIQKIKNQMRQLVVEQNQFQSGQLKREQTMERQVAQLQKAVEALVKKLEEVQ
ncbi:hypothetical protein BGZ54_003382 [Gamsiella multidivaricata]|nr:hypothetical protein BGZ54_003382 [Gamsiella multidivaricata]